MSINLTSFNGKIFGVGFHKTGTTSLHIFLKLLGYHGTHWPDRVKGVHYQKLCAPQLHDTKLVIEILMPVFSQFETFCDVPIPALYQELDDRFPDSRFILMERNAEEWWASLVKHWHLVEKQKRILDPYEYLQYNYGGSIPLYEITIDNKTEVLHRYSRHLERVKDYFQGRSNAFLPVSMHDPDIAERIAAFLQFNEFPNFPKARRSSVSGPPSTKW